MPNTSCRIVQKLPQKKETLGNTNTEREVEKGNKEGPKKVDKESNTVFEALVDKSSILRKPKCPLFPGSVKPRVIPNHVNLPYTYLKRNTEQKIIRQMKELQTSMTTFQTPQKKNKLNSDYKKKYPP